MWSGVFPYRRQKVHYRLRLKRDGTRAETRFRLALKRTSPFKLAGASVQSTAGSRSVCISGSNAGYTKFRVSEGYWIPTPFASFPFTSPTVRHRVPSGFKGTLRMSKNIMLTVLGTFTDFFSPTTPIPRQSHTIIFWPIYHLTEQACDAYITQVPTKPEFS